MTNWPYPPPVRHDRAPHARMLCVGNDPADTGSAAEEPPSAYAAKPLQARTAGHIRPLTSSRPAARHPHAGPRQLRAGAWKSARSAWSSDTRRGFARDPSNSIAACPIIERCCSSFGAPAAGVGRPINFNIAVTAASVSPGRSWLIIRLASNQGIDFSAATRRNFSRLNLPVSLAVVRCCCSRAR